MTWELALTISIALAAPALLVSVLLTMQNWENRRFVRINCRRNKHLPDAPHAAVVVPVKGIDLELKKSLRSLMHQDYDSYEVHFVGESDDDPAHQVVQELIAEQNHCDVHWHAAGQATDCGQKVHNLQYACDRLGDDVKVVAFADSDAHPDPHWLHSLAFRLTATDPRQGATTGYRVCVPARPTLANFLIYSINSSVGSMLVSCSPLNMIWGGSWIVHRDLLEQKVRPAWPRTISDDVVATGVMQAERKRIGFEARIMVPSKTEMSLSGTIEFLRRQFYMTRHYSRWLWRAHLATSTLMIAAFWFCLALAVGGGLAGSPRWWIPGVMVSLLYGLGMWRAKMRQEACDESIPQCKSSLAAARRFEMFAHPFASLVAWVGLVGSAFGHDVIWRNIRYRLDRQGQVVELEHLQEPHLAEAPLASESKADGRRAA